MSLFIFSCFLLERSFPRPLVYLSVMNLKGCLSSQVINDPRRSYSSKNHEEMAGGKRLDTESHRHSSPPTTRGPIKSVWGLKVSSFRHQRLREISVIPNPSTIQASQVEIKQGLRKRATLRNQHGAGRQSSHVLSFPSCHATLSRYPPPAACHPPRPG